MEKMSNNLMYACLEMWKYLMFFVTHSCLYQLLWIQKKKKLFYLRPKWMFSVLCTSGINKVILNWELWWHNKLRSSVSYFILNRLEVGHNAEILIHSLTEDGRQSSWTRCGGGKFSGTDGGGNTLITSIAKLSKTSEEENSCFRLFPLRGNA